MLKEKLALMFLCTINSAELDNLVSTILERMLILDLTLLWSDIYLSVFASYHFHLLLVYILLIFTYNELFF